MVAILPRGDKLNGPHISDNIGVISDYMYIRWYILCGYYQRLSRLSHYGVIKFGNKVQNTTCDTRNFVSEIAVSWTYPHPPQSNANNNWMSFDDAGARVILLIRIIKTIRYQPHKYIYFLNGLIHFNWIQFQYFNSKKLFATKKPSTISQAKILETHTQKNAHPATAIMWFIHRWPSARLQ